MEQKESQIIAKGIKKGIYRTFEIDGQPVIIDDFTYRRLFRDPDIKPKRKYTFIRGFVFSNGYVRLVLRPKKTKAISLSRYIMHAAKGKFVDHVNRNRFDNRRCNLRLTNSRQNVLNRVLKNNTGLISVSTRPVRNNFFLTASFRTKTGEKLAFACPDTPFNRILAALAHDKFILQEREEEYAPLNFPQWQYEPMRSILMKEDLRKYKEKGIRKISGGTDERLNRRIEKFLATKALRHKEYCL